MTCHSHLFIDRDSAILKFEKKEMQSTDNDRRGLDAFKD